MPVRGWLGAALLDAGRTREAQEQFEVCLSLRPDDPWIAHQLAIARLQLGDAAGALRILDRLLSRHPDHASARATQTGARAILGEVVTPEEFQALLLSLDELEASRDVSTLQILRGLWPIEELTLRHRLVRSLLRLHRRTEGEARLTQMLRRWPDDLETIANLGMIRVDLGRAADAIPLLQTAVTRDPTSYMLRLGLARAYREVGRREDAQKTAREALALAGNEQERIAVQRFLAGR
jgi:predicted Zn-dependent protease